MKPGSLMYNDGISDYAIDETTGAFTMPDSDVTVSAEFGVKYFVTVPSFTGGTVMSDTSVTLEGTLVTLTVTPRPRHAAESGEPTVQ